MKKQLGLPLLTLLLTLSARAADPAVTIYNQNFAVVRETLPLDLKPGVNSLSFANATGHAQPETVTLRDPAGKVSLKILEQNYRNDPISQALLLSFYEGKTINFRVRGNEKDEIVPGKIIRSGYAMHDARAMRRYGQQYYQSQAAMAYSGGGGGEPLIEVNGELQFGLPGEPRFPALPDDSVLKPTFTWEIQSAAAVKLDAELAYISDGMSWDADYNVVAPEKGDALDVTGWVTIDNQSGRTFTNARVKLMAGDLSRVAEPEQFFARAGMAATSQSGPPVTEKTIDEYHLYTLERPATLRDRETKQVEFVRANAVQSQRLYIYEGAKIDQNQYRGYNFAARRANEEYGTQSNPKVWVMQEIRNSAANHLGMPLPRGTLRFYRRDADGRVEFTGENVIDHTAKDETLRIYTGNAFDLAGERRRTNFKMDDRRQSWADESFEIKLRNHKTEPVEIRVVERLYRGANWEITAKSDSFLKTEAQTIEFRIPLKPDEEKTVTYTVHYTW
jgi:hypothetical protein